MQVLGAGEGDPDLGQTPSSSPCSHWKLEFRNNSNTEIVAITFTSKSAEYLNTGQYNAQTNRFATIVAATPSAVNLNVSLPPYAEQTLEFDTCTSTPPPGNGYNMSTAPSPLIEYQWASGQRRYAPID